MTRLLSSRLPVLLLLLTAATPSGAVGQGGGAPAVEANPSTALRAGLPQPVQGRTQSFWINAGVGVGTLDLAAAASASYQFGSSLLSVRTAATGEFELLGPADELWDVGLLYGRATPPGTFHAALGAGVALVRGTLRGGGGFGPPEREERIPTTVGLPVELQLFWRPTTILGLGIYGFANANREQSFAGAALSVQLGSLR
ncbi:MAG: hypothetical protein H0X65_20345 [Gemmatimonadetes bacterium]|nr:hypothetical protein [Gemmatimonadota bacterium]